MTFDFRIRATLAWALAIVISGFLFYSVRQAYTSLQSVGFLTGWWLVGIMCFLVLLSARKKLSMIPLGRASTWLLVHSVGGVLILSVYWLHTTNIWPSGFYEQILATLFYLTVLTGMFGYIIQRIFPKRLTQTGIELIYERIPKEILDIRLEAEQLILECTQETKSETLALHYLDTLAWFFQSSRFFGNHVAGSQRGSHWIRKQQTAVSGYLGDDEEQYLARLISLAQYKNNVDIHYALQSVMKRWLVLHVPLTVGLVIMSVWHVLLVHIYAA